MSLTYT